MWNMSQAWRYLKWNKKKGLKWNTAINKIMGDDKRPRRSSTSTTHPNVSPMIMKRIMIEFHALLFLFQQMFTTQKSSHCIISILSCNARLLKVMSWVLLLPLCIIFYSHITHSTSISFSDITPPPLFKFIWWVMMITIMRGWIMVFEEMVPSDTFPDPLMLTGYPFLTVSWAAFLRNVYIWFPSWAIFSSASSNVFKSHQLHPSNIRVVMGNGDDCPIISIIPQKGKWACFSQLSSHENESAFHVNQGVMGSNDVSGWIMM